MSADPARLTTSRHGYLNGMRHDQRGSELTDATGRPIEASPGHIDMDPPRDDARRLPPPPPPDATGRSPEEYRGVGITAGVVALVVVAALVVAVVAQNTDDVTFELLWWDSVVPLAVVILVTVFVTLVTDELVGLVWRRRRRQVLRLQRRGADRSRRRR